MFGVEKQAGETTQETASGKLGETRSPEPILQLSSDIKTRAGRVTCAGAMPSSGLYYSSVLSVLVNVIHTN
jgi:hypothetical protein